MIIGITGLTKDNSGRCSIAGSGKDTVAARLAEKHQFVSVALADPMKRFCKEIFGFTDEQLWGPSEARNKPDRRYRRGLLVHGRSVGKSTDVPDTEPLYLTPRYALQQLGTEWGRDCYPDLWVNYCLCVAERLMTHGFCYLPRKGLFSPDSMTASVRLEIGYKPEETIYPPVGVVIPDVRFINEFNRIKEAGGKVWRVKRQIESIPGELGEGHLSERELLELPDESFDAIFPNEGSIHHLHLLVDAVMARETGRIIDYDEAQEDVPPYQRKK